MNVQLAPQIEAMIQAKIESGPYRDADEVMWEALRLLDERDRRVGRLRVEVAKGLERLDRGEGVELTPERLELIMQRALENARRGKPIKDAVKP